jgi:glutathione peroxidase
MVRTHVASSARQHRVVLHSNSITGGKRPRDFSSLARIRQARLLTTYVGLLVLLVGVGAFVSLKLYPHPREGDIVVDDTRPGVGSGRKELAKPLIEAGTPDLLSVLETLLDTDGRRVDVDDLRGRVLLIANVASQCGYTASNYATFASLALRFHHQGLRVVAVPCGQFGSQEFERDDDIRRFVRSSYDQSATPMITLLKRMDDGIDTNPLFTWLRTHGDDASPVSWNFNKWLVDRQGHVRKRYDSADHLEDLERDVLSMLDVSK